MNRHLAAAHVAAAAAHVDDARRQLEIANKHAGPVMSAVIVGLIAEAADLQSKLERLTQAGREEAAITKEKAS